MSALTSSTMDLLKIGLVSDRLSPMALRGVADWTVKPRLLAAPGVTQVNVFGGEVRQVQIQVQPDRLLAHGITIADVLAAARASRRGLRRVMRAPSSPSHPALTTPWP